MTPNDRPRLPTSATQLLNYFSYPLEPPPDFDMGWSISNDGKWLAGTVQGILGLWRLSDGKLHESLDLLGQLEQQWKRSTFSVMGFTPDGQYLLAAVDKFCTSSAQNGSRDAPEGLYVFIFEAGARTLKGACYLGSGDGLDAWAISPDSSVLATSAHADGYIRLWQIPNGHPIRSWAEASCVGDFQDPRMESLQFSPNGQHLMSGSVSDALGGEGRVRLWNADGSNLVETLNPRHGLGTGTTPRKGVFGSSSSIVATLAPQRVTDEPVLLWYLRDTWTRPHVAYRGLLHPDAGLASIQFSSDGKWLAYTDDLGGFVLHRTPNLPRTALARSGTAPETAALVVRGYKCGEAISEMQVAFADGDHLLVTATDHETRIWPLDLPFLGETRIDIDLDKAPTRSADEDTEGGIQF